MPEALHNIFKEDFQKERKEGREEGREEGRILETVDIYRNELEMDDETIIDRIIKKFGLSRKSAESFVLQTA